MELLKNSYSKFYIGFLASILIVFFYTRPLNSPWQKFIDGDGLGYYSYLPATFIYHDTNYNFKWFNEVHRKNYEFCSFPSPDDNFLVQYQNKKINKYYQGLSFAWLPFFGLAHIIAKISGYPADGYSLPYQLCIGLASLCYLFLGLWYLRKLILKLYQHQWVAVIVPIALFYGTWLSYYSLQLNSLSHVYSFTFITLFLYHSWCFFNENKKQNLHFALALLFFIITICIRPLNGSIVLAALAFIPAGFFKQKQLFSKPTRNSLALIIVAFIILAGQLYILHRQTGSFLPYTYTGERFYFSNPKLAAVLISYHSGLFVYVPLALVSLGGIFFLKTRTQKILISGVFLLAIYLYSSWWYWPITTRALIDFYPLLAILLAALMVYVFKSPKGKYISLGMLFLLIAYHQLKSMQVHNGILHENYTYSNLFWRNFFRIKKANLFPVPPSTIVKTKSYVQNFDTTLQAFSKTTSTVYSGTTACLLDAKSPFSPALEYTIPEFMKEAGIKKIRFSFWCNFKEEVKGAQIYLKFFNAHDTLVNEIPYYINTDVIKYNQWDYKEFGYEFGDTEITDKNIRRVSLFIWNNEAKNEIVIDDVTTEFLITDRSYDIIK